MAQQPSRNSFSVEQVFEAIKTERGYQNTKWTELDELNSTGDFLVFMQKYMTRAIETNHPGDYNEVMRQIRKIVAIGFAAMEKYGYGNDIATPQISE